MGAFVTYQTGSITIANGASAGTFTIPTNVNRANCILTVRCAGIDATVTNSYARVTINAAGTTVTATRAGTLGDLTMDLEIYEDTGITTEWVQLTQNATSLDTTITAVDLSRSIAYITGGVTRSSTSRGNDDFPLCELTTTTNLQTRCHTAGSITFVVQVIQFESGLTNSVQWFSKALTTTTGSQTITSVDTSKSIVFPAGMNASATTIFSSEIHSFGLDSSTSVGFESYAVPSASVSYAFYVVEFTDLVVNPGVSGSLTTASATPTIVLSSSPTRGAFLLQGPYNTVATDNSNDDAIRDTFKGTVSSATWTLTRGTADDSKLRYSAWDWSTLRAAVTSNTKLALLGAGT